MIRIKQIIAEKIPTRLLAHSEQILSARRYLSTHFFCWFDKIYVKIIVDLTEILNSWLEIEILRNGHFGRLSYFDCAPASLWTTKLLVMAFNFNWFIKITRSFGSGFQIQDCKARSKIDHDWEQIWSRLSYQIRLRNSFGFELVTHSLPIVVFFIVSIMFIFLCQWHYWLDLPGTQILFFISYS